LRETGCTQICLPLRDRKCASPVEIL